MGFEIDINLKWLRGISQPNWQKNKTMLLRDDVIIKLVLVATFTDCMMFSCLSGNTDQLLKSNFDKSRAK